MNNFKKLNLEERLNTLSHAAGILFGIIGCFVLLNQNTYKTNFSVFSILVYALSFIILFAASTLYHYTAEKTLKQRYRILDHISIYLLIAGTYTPVLLITLINMLKILILNEKIYFSMPMMLLWTKRKKGMNGSLQQKKMLKEQMPIKQQNL